MMTDYCCAHCGGRNLGPIQKGIDNWPMALCWDCRPKGKIAPPDDDRSEKAEKARQAVIKEAAGALRTRPKLVSPLSPLMLASEWPGKRSKTKEEKGEDMWAGLIAEAPKKSRMGD